MNLVDPDPGSGHHTSYVSSGSGSRELKCYGSVSGSKEPTCYGSIVFESWELICYGSI